MKRLFLLDGSALVYRAFYAMQRSALTTAEGEPTGAVFGFANALQMILTQEKPDYLAVVFDPPGPTFRHERYPEYKATRRETPEELRAQMPRVRELVRAWPCALLEMPGMEADDVIGSYATQLAGPDLEVVAVTGDKDFYQLLGRHVHILNPGRGGPARIDSTLLGPDDVEAKFGVTDPDQVVDVLGLMGDSSDNVPGVAGIGPKTAGTLIAEHGSLEAVYEHLDELKPGVRTKLETDRDQAFLSRELVTIRTDLDLPLPLDELAAREPGGEALVELLRRLEFTRLLHDLGLDRKPSELTLLGRHDGYRLVSDRGGLQDLVERLQRAEDGFAVDTETTSLDPHRADLVGIAIAAGPGEGYYVNCGHAEGAEPIPMVAVTDALGPLLADPERPKVTHHGKYDMHVLARAGLPVKGVAFDTMIASYLVDPEGSHKLDDLARTLLGEDMIPITELIGKRGPKQKTMAEVDAEVAARYAAEDADMTWRLSEVYRKKLDQLQLGSLFRDVEMPLLDVLFDMEQSGVALDVKYLETMSGRLEKKLEGLVERCRELAGEEFNLNSPKQLAGVLFEKLGLPTGKKTKTGYSTDSEVLERLREHHELPAAVLEYRQVAKLKSTYVDTLPQMIHPETGRVHASFNQTVAATGRLSSSDPNLQNIPIRTELGREVRRAFVAGEPDWVMISADYSQIELRIMAHLSRDPALLEAFRDGVDVHSDTAARIFGVESGDVTPTQRGQAKTVNFGVLYGQGAFGLARTLGIPRDEAAAFIKAYKIQYAGVMEYLDGTLERAKKDGYVTTLLQRRRYLPALKYKSAAARAAAERLAVNTPIQGSAADMIKVAMVQLHPRLEKLQARLLMQVHDELVLECPRDEADEVTALVTACMEQAVKLDVPVLVNVGVGANWAEIH